MSNLIEKETNKGREFGLTTLSINNKVTVFVITCILVIVGITSYINLPKETFPEVEFPSVYVGTTYPGNSPEDMENLVTRPIEKEINGISGISINNISSTSVQDYSTIIVEFSTDVKIETALRKVKDAVDKAKPELPTDLPTDPNVFDINLSEFPILNINLSGDYSLAQLKEYAEYLEDEIEKFKEVSKAEIRGVDEMEVKIDVDPFAMEARNVSFDDIENAVAAENLTMSGGNLLAGEIRRSIRILGEYTDPKLLEDVVVKNEGNSIVYLKDIGKVTFDYKEKESYARLDGQQVVMVDVVKRSGENLLILTDKIYDVLEKAKENVFPADLNVIVTNDQSKATRDQVSNLENSIIFGVILVVLVLLFFLGTRNALFVGMAIPLSMFLSFMILGLFGITINMMVLFSLIMALGMLVDNGIVVVENVYRLMEEGESAYHATKRGVGEVALPIISSTATTLAAFLPLAFWPGIFGEFMKYLPITLIITLSSSLFVALVINPVFLASFIKIEDHENVVNHKRVIRTASIFILVGIVLLVLSLTVLGNLAIIYGVLVLLNIYVLMPLSKKFQNGFLPWLEGLYVKTLRVCLLGLRPLFLFIGTGATLIFSFILLGVFAPNVVFFPDNEPLYVNVFIEYPVGTDIETTNKLSEEIEAKVMEIIKPYSQVVESVIANVGQGAADPNDPSAIGEVSTPHKGRITVNFIEYKERNGVSTEAVMSEIRDGIKGYPGVTLTVDKNQDGPPAGKPVNIEVQGDDYLVLIDLANNIKNYINDSGIDGIEQLKLNVETGKPELIINIDRDKARRFGLSTFAIASEIRTALFGKKISKYKLGEDDYDIQLRLEEQYRHDLDALLNKSITFRNQTDGKIYQVPISSVAKAEYNTSFGSVNRKDLNRMITISSNVLSDYNPTKINDQLKVILADFEMPKGYEYKFTGEQEKQEEEMAFLSNALMVAVFMIFLIIVAQFNKVSSPFIIMTTVVFSTIGVFLGLVIFRMDFVIVMTMIGIISLAGIVVNNAIVLMDFIELVKDKMKSSLPEGTILTADQVREAIIEAGRTRLRPVLLTAITTILGLIPLAFGINIDFIKFLSEYDIDFFMGGDNALFWGPMAWTIIFGLTFATFLTLVIVPVMYLLGNKINARFGIGR